MYRKYRLIQGRLFREVRQHPRLVMAMAIVCFAAAVAVVAISSGRSRIALVVAILFFVITRGVRAVLGPRRRLEEEVSVSLLRGRLARGEISQDEFDQAARIVGAERP